MNKPQNIYILYTGGTIGMIGRPLTPMSPDKFKTLLSSMPGFTDQTITLQTSENVEITINYTLEAFETPIDSSNMTPQDWVAITELILDNYWKYDGFVVLHGTDTLSWTASALSYMLEGLTKPVIVTGSQIPLAQTRNDGLRNLTTSIMLAATSNVPEVCLFFNTDLMRGNRAVKVNTCQFNGFISPKHPPLAVSGIETHVNQEFVIPFPPESISLNIPENLKKIQIRLKNMKPLINQFSVIAMILFPGIEASMIKAMINSTKPHLKGLVLLAFGEGNAPSTTAFLETMTQADHTGITIVNVTQCLKGSVNINAYDSASGLRKAGVISGYDLTPEAALSKLFYLIAQGLTQNDVKKHIQTPIAGDLNLPNK